MRIVLKQLSFTILLGFLFLGVQACGDDDDDLGDTAGDTDSDTDSDTDTDSDSDADTDTDTDSDADADSDGDTDTDADADTDTDADADSDGDTDTDADADTDTDTDADGMMTISGIVKRTGANIPAGSDGTGTLCLAVQNRCPDIQAVINPPTAYDDASAVIENADFSDKANEIPFEITCSHDYLKDGKYRVGGYLKVAGGECSKAGPDKDDPVTFDRSTLGGKNGCPEFSVSGGADVADLVVELNFNMIAI